MAVLTLSWAEFPPPEFTGGCVTIGNFDGVHRGHATLVGTAKRLAQSVNGPTVAVTFDPPPVALLNPAAWKLPLSTLADRTAALLAAGADHVVFLKTEPSLLALSAEAFFEDVLVRQLGAKAVVEGYNFHFGHARGGNTAVLRVMCAAAGIAFEEVQPLLVNGEPVSSSRVRSAVNAGDVATAANLLGRPYAIAGEVVTGAKRGRTIGFPTANLDRVETLLPAVGVYAVRATVGDQTYAAAANIGPNPTFGEDARKVEIHLLDFAGDLYGRTMGVEFVARLRETKPFANVAALVEQLQRDIAATRTALL
ncbi:bifunctional riboflavin kinase/FAD synthetase [Limnoglobus roseus]|uniref:Riboflavin biosynthesis protein n=1 Tax=Limnoglobus roseus TaxID=2598579 RepID=A0A5C1A7R2_9BACT|nr:bifunctional riboflavin kinase/FAD synthetase [Limnoglobus roseus]QEL15231.1 riboflavin biosynthesis protein RibF [Limnoglobus roseus]